METKTKKYKTNRFVSNYGSFMNLYVTKQGRKLKGARPPFWKLAPSYF